MAYATNSLGNYSGTIVSSPIRPFGPNEALATVFSNEIKGGHHNYEFISERDSLIVERRDWGMLVTIYGDPTSSNNKTYKLEYNFSSSSLNDNDNWIEYNPSGITFDLNSEWVDSVDEINSFPSGSEPDGYRYLVSSPAIGVFLGQDDKVAEYNATIGSFSFYEPKNGTTLRVDTLPNVLYRYSGTYSTGNWVTEVLNSVRYLNAFSGDGLTYSATSSHSPVYNLFDSVYYVNFNFTSSGTVSLIIDGMSASQILKLENNTLNDVVSNDLIPGLQYQLIWNGSAFQTTLPSSTTTTIGPAEDGNYTDGVFTDFIPSTPIGTAVDRFNEFLLNLVPASGPTLSSWDAIGSFVNGGVSFDNTTSFGILNTATSSPYGSVSAGETFSSLDSYYRLGITSRVVQPITGTQFYSDISGILNVNVTQDLQLPFPAYATYSFGYADSGTLSFFVNGTTVSQIGLTSGSIDTTSGGATSGLFVSAPTASRFFNGNYYEPYQNRTGSYLLKADSSDIVDGYNYIVVQHETDTNNYVLSQFEFVSDPSTTDVTIGTPFTVLINYSLARKWSSGIEFYTYPLQFVYSAVIQNAFSNTYNQDSDAVQYLDLSQLMSGVTNSVTGTITNSYTSSVVTPVINSSKLVPDSSFNPSSTMTINMTYSINYGVRRVNDSVSFGLQVKRTVQGTFSGGTSSGLTYPVDNWFIDTVLPTSTDLVENFDDENYRLKNGSTKYNTYNLSSDVLVGTWSSLSSIYNGSQHDNGLQVINGILIYPNFNFSQNGPGSLLSNPNYGLGPNRDYTDCRFVSQGFGTYSGSPLTTNRTYTRWFNFGNVINYSRAIIKITHNSTSFINTTTPIVGNSDVWVEVKLPYDSGSVPGGTMSTGGVTGWLDATKPFTGTYEDGDGCLSGVVPTISGDEWFIDFGVKGTIFSGGYVLLRITAGQDWLGNINSITLIPD